jgi:cell wall assembly regulator SMI1
VHWFGELLGFYVAIAVAGFAVVSARKLPVYRAQRRAADLEYTARHDWQQSWHCLYDANISAIDAIECGMAPGFPDEVRTAMLAAHQGASEIERKESVNHGKR